MNRRTLLPSLRCGHAALLAALLIGFAALGCDHLDIDMGVTSDGDFTLIVEAPDRSLRIGDEGVLLVRLSRTDNSNLDPGLTGTITLTTSRHGALTRGSLPVLVTDETTPEFLANVSYRADRAGVAAVRATFQDATAAVEILISEGAF